MSDNQTACDRRLIELFLDQQLSDDEQAALEEHLGECRWCREALDARAADAEAWREVRESLSGLVVAPEEFGAVGDGDDGTQSEMGSQASQGSQGSHGSQGSEDSNQSAATVGRSDAFPRSLLAPTDDPRMLGRLGPYEIVGVIGCGGMGWVLKGFDAALNRYVAIKMLAMHLAASGSARVRFDREAKAAAAVVHDNVIPIHSVAEWNGMPYLVMPYLRGESLDRRLLRQGPLTVVEILRVGVQMASGLAAAHALGLVHRDIKPANILLETGVERLRITDFGLARAVDDASLTRTGVIAGTPQFMSPEQARGEMVDSRSDLFSLGSVLYAVATGRPPFRAETTFGVLRRITDTEPRPVREINPEVPEWLAAIVAKLHAKDPAGRFQSAEQLSELLSQCLAHVQQPTLAPLPEMASTLLTCDADASGDKPRPTRPLAQKIALAASTAIVVCLVLLAAVFRHNLFDGDGDSTAPGETASVSADDSAADPTLDAAKTAWRDGLSEDLADLSGQVDQLQRQSQTLWGTPETSVDNSPKEKMP